MQNWSWMWASWAVVVVGVVATAGCGTDTGPGSGDAGLTSPGDADAAAIADASADSAAVPDSASLDAATQDFALGPAPTNLQVHHWATFTVFHAAVAQQHVPGVARAEEELPAFVHSRSLATAGPPLAKIQTAGAFFHVDTPGDVRLDLAVPQGQVSADWPPAASGVQGSAAALTAGHATWQLHVEPSAAKLPALPAVAPDSLWQALRDAGGARVTNLGGASGSEDLLFYRALGNFAPPLRILANKSAAVEGYEGSVSNDGDVVVARAWLLYLHAGGGLLQPLNKLPGNSNTQFSPTPKELPARYFANVEGTLTTELQNAGLTGPEAKALFRSFSHNWLKTYGLRVIVVAPQAWADAYAQAKVTPKPAQEVRVVLGRFELLTTADETTLLTQLAAAAKTPDSGMLQALGFFAEPKARRALQASTDPAVKALAEQLIKQAEVLE